MTLVEALALLRSDPRHAEAAATLHAELERLSWVSRLVPAFREEALQDIEIKALELVRDDRFATVANPGAYLAQSLRYRSYSLYRRERLRREKELQAPPPRAPSDPPPPTPDLARLEELYTKALSRRQPRYRPHLERSWRELLQVMRGRTVAGLLRAAGEEPTPSAINGVYKAHERLRQALFDVIDYRLSTGSFVLEDAEVYRREVQLLVRCQGRGPLSVFLGEDDDDE